MRLHNHVLVVAPVFLEGVAQVLSHDDAAAAATVALSAGDQARAVAVRVLRVVSHAMPSSISMPSMIISSAKSSALPNSER